MTQEATAPSPGTIRIKKGRLILDVVLGVLAPIFCLVFDVGVFNGEIADAGTVFWFLTGPSSRVPLFAYLAIGLGMLALLFWRIGGWTLNKWASEVMAGVLFAGAAFALIIGILLLPVSLLGLLLYGVGILGYIPFGTFGVYLPSGMEALAQARTMKPTQPRRLRANVAAGFVAVLGIPALIQWGVSRTITDSLYTILDSPSVGATIQAEETLEAVYILCGDICLHDIPLEYNRVSSGPGDFEWHQQRRKAILKVYQEVTGKRLFGHIPIPSLDPIPLLRRYLLG